MQESVPQCIHPQELGSEIAVDRLAGVTVAPVGRGLLDQGPLLSEPSHRLQVLPLAFLVAEAARANIVCRRLADREKGEMLSIQLEAAVLGVAQRQAVDPEWVIAILRC